MQVSVQRLPKSAIKLTVTVPADKVKEAQEKVLARIASEAEIDGFRKGKAPVELVKQKLNQQKFDAEVMGDLIKTYYPQALDQEKLAPIISPKIELDGYEPDKDFTFTAETAVRPQITVGDYKKAVKASYDAKTAEMLEISKERKKKFRELESAVDKQFQSKESDSEKEAVKAKSETPSAQDSPQKSSKDDGSEHNHDQQDSQERNHVHMTPTDIVDAILTVTQVEIPDMIVAEEVDRMLTRLVQQLQPLNLAMESFLKSTNKTGDQLRAEYAEIAKKNVASEMALIEIVKKEQIGVTDKEIDATVTTMGDEKLKQRYMENPVEKAYVIAIIAKNKLIWKLISEVEGTLEHTEAPNGEKNGEVSKDKEQAKSALGNEGESKNDAKN